MQLLEAAPAKSCCSMSAPSVCCYKAVKDFAAGQTDDAVRSVVK